jgi:hypothetical protein
VRHCWLALLTFSFTHLFVAADAFAQPRPLAGQRVPVPPADAPPLVGQPVPVRPVDARTETAQLLVPHLLPSLAQDKEAAGLAQESQPELLTWDRIYPLTLVRARRASVTFEATLDPKTLAEESNRLGVADFARFRQEFLAPHSAAGTGLRDPGAAFLDLLRRVLAIDNARRNVAFHENVEKFVMELIQAESSGLSRVDCDLIRNAALRARQRLANEIAQYRNRLDELKVSLGFSPRAAVLPSRTSLGAFEVGFRKVEDWIKQPDRSLPDLPKIIQQLPLIGDVFIDGHPFLRRIDEAPDSLEAIVTEVGQLAIKTTKEPEKAAAPRDQAIDRELNARRQFRHLNETRRAYESEKANYELVIRLADQSFERLCSPPEGNARSRSTIVAALLEHADALRRSADRLIALWTTFRADRLALYRELGVLPYHDWSSFYGQFAAGPGRPEEAPAEQPANAIAPPPPPPPAPQ